MPNGDTVLLYLNSQDQKGIEDIFFKHVIHTVKTLKNKGKLSRAAGISIDWTHLMFYGDPTAPMVLGTNRKNGSNYAYGYLTATLLIDGERIILGVFPVSKRSDIADLTIKLITFIKDDAGIKIGYLLFDRDFSYCN